MKRPYYLSILFLILMYVLTGVLIQMWFPREVPAPLVTLGGASAIFFYFFATNFEEKSLALLSFLLNNICLYYILQIPDPWGFFAGLFLILLATFHLFLFFGPDVLMYFIFFSVLLSRIFFHPKMGEWGFGLVTEFFAINLHFHIYRFFQKGKSEEKSTSRVFHFIPFLFIFLISFLNLLSSSYSLNEIFLNMNFYLAGASFLCFVFFANNPTELKISFFVYIIVNFYIGFYLAQSFKTFLGITFLFLLFNGSFASFYYLRAKRKNEPFSQALLSNKREGIQSILIMYFLLLGILLVQLNPGSAALSPHSNWIMGLGLQVGFLTALNYFFRN